MTTENIFYICLVLFVLFTWFKFSKHKFIYCKSKPHTRHCCTCVQLQIEVHNGEFLYDMPLTYWQDSGRIYDENCHCHDYTNC